MAARIVGSFLLAFFAATLVEASRGYHGGPRGPPPGPGDPFGPGGGQYSDDWYQDRDTGGGDDDDDDNDDDDSGDKGLIVGAIIGGAILLATAAIVTTLCCLKKAKRTKRLIRQDPLSRKVAVVPGSPAKLRYATSDLPKYTPRNKKTSTPAFHVPAVTPTPVEQGRPSGQNGSRHAESDLPPPYSPPPSYSSQINVKENGYL